MKPLFDFANLNRSAIILTSSSLSLYIALIYHAPTDGVCDFESLVASRAIINGFSIAVLAVIAFCSLLKPEASKCAARITSFGQISVYMLQALVNLAAGNSAIEVTVGAALLLTTMTWSLVWFSAAEYGKSPVSMMTS